jgi:ribonucleoside-diphosphate reductase alpha chain
MDDLVDLEAECIKKIIWKIQADPESEEIKFRELDMWREIEFKCLYGRRTGTGITALGDTIAALNLGYGSDQSIEFAEQIYKTLKFGCYRASVDMSRELGSFPIWEFKQEKHNPFLNRFNDETIEIEGQKISGKQLYQDMAKFGRRNISLLTTAPAGSVSILAQANKRPYWGTTSGIEPLFTDKPYTRRKKINHSDKNSRVDFIDDQGDKWTNYQVYHAGLKMWMDITGETDYTKSPYHRCCAEDLDWKQRVKLQAAATRHLDHSVSSTLNLPNDVTEQKVAEIYETAWHSKCKGITVYRDGCRAGVLVKESSAKPQNTDAPKRPKELPCEIHHLTVKKEPYVVAIGLYDSKPYELFAFSNNHNDCLLAKKHSHGIIKKSKRGIYELWNKEENLLPNCESISSLLTDTEAALTRMVSTSMRHGVNLQFTVHQLEKVKGDMFSFAKAIARVLKKYVEDGAKVTGEICQNCGEPQLIRHSGCVQCRNCSWTKCV